MKTSLGLPTLNPPLFQDLAPTFHTFFSNSLVLTQYHLLRQDIVSMLQASISQLVMTSHTKNKERVW